MFATAVFVNGLIDEKRRENAKNAFVTRNQFDSKYPRWNATLAAMIWHVLRLSLVIWEFVSNAIVSNVPMRKLVQ